MRSLYGLTIALSAFLLFSVEPMATRALLPTLGGSSAVWITALCFFQLTLLAGYGYSVYTARASRRQPVSIALHLLLLGLAAASLAAPASLLAPAAASSLAPQLRLFRSLLLSTGLPFFVLSTTTPLLQAWYARREQRPVPYRLFAISNLSSLVALLLYPTVFEPHLDLHAQHRLWSLGFLIFAACVATLTLRMRQAPGVVYADSSGCLIDETGLTAEFLPVSTREATPAGAGPSHDVSKHSNTQRSRTLLWFALPAVASMQLAAVTAHLTENVAAMPLLWLAPLAIYLLTFVLAFDAPRLYRRGLLVRLLAVLLASLGYLLSKTGVSIPMELAVLFFLAELLVACWFLHAELFALRPLAARTSTVFYLWVAAGGAAGAVFVAILSPLLFRSNYDLALSFALTAAMAAVVTWQGGWAQRLLWITGTALACLLVGAIHHDFARNAIFRGRNFYGALRVKETHTPPEAVTVRTLLHGSIQHGMQWFSEADHRTPMTYYAEDSGVGLAIRLCCGETRPRNIGVIGLGTGTIAAYGRPGDHVQFYEINPLVIDIAHSFFSYTRESSASITVVPGDARLSLAAEPPQAFDVLAVDAFSGDAIPVHLLTREALALYRRHLAPGGVLAFHISNQYLDLEPVLARLALEEHLEARRIESPARPSRGEFTATWILLTDRPSLFDDPGFAHVAEPATLRANVPVWTDSFSSLLPILRWSSRRTSN